MKLHEFLNRLWYLTLFPLVDPPAFLAVLPEKPEDDGDGRFFAWVRQEGGRTQVTPVIIYDKTIGAKMEMVGDLHLLKPHEYGDDLDVLADRYPLPAAWPNNGIV